MSTKNQVLLSFLTVALLWTIIHSFLGGNSWATLLMVALVLTLIWTGQEKKLLKYIAGGAFLALLLITLFSWGPTSGFMGWLSARGELGSPRNNFNPRGERLGGRPEASAGVVICDDDRSTPVRRAPLDYKTDPDSGCMVVPMTIGYAKKLAEKEAQKKALQTTFPSASAVNNYPCTFTEGTTQRSARILGPGKFEEVSPRRLASAQYTFGVDGTGTWTQTYPEDSGMFELQNNNFTGQKLIGSSWSAKSPHKRMTISLTCPNLTPLAPSS